MRCVTMSVSLTLRSTCSDVGVINACFEAQVFESFYLLLLNKHYI